MSKSSQVEGNIQTSWNVTLVPGQAGGEKRPVVFVPHGLLEINRSLAQTLLTPSVALQDSQQVLVGHTSVGRERDELCESDVPGEEP